MLLLIGQETAHPLMHRYGSSSVFIIIKELFCSLGAKKGNNSFMLPAFLFQVDSGGWTIRYHCSPAVQPLPFRWMVLIKMLINSSKFPLLIIINLWALQAAESGAPCDTLLHTGAPTLLVRFGSCSLQTCTTQPLTEVLNVVFHQYLPQKDNKW